MTDHNVSPAVTESEMNTFRDIFTRFADTVTNASQLSQDVANLRIQVEQITRDLQTAASTNAYLSDKLSQVQREKDEAQGKVAIAEGELARTKSELERVNRDFQATDETIRRYEGEITSLKRERDDAHFRVLELEDKLKESDGRWGKLRELFGDGKDVAPQAHPSAIEPAPIKPEPYAGQDSWR